MRDATMVQYGGLTYTLSVVGTGVSNPTRKAFDSSDLMQALGQLSVARDEISGLLRGERAYLSRSVDDPTLCRWYAVDERGWHRPVGRNMRIERVMLSEKTDA